MGQVRAVQYLRMSTEYQRYSLENQATAIAAYANGRGHAIVGTYADPARSGLIRRERKEIARLLRDARGPTAISL
jgi:DNA invertase Pin-like site-specific DNA recombinase